MDNNDREARDAIIDRCFSNYDKALLGISSEQIVRKESWVGGTLHSSTCMGKVYKDGMLALLYSAEIEIQKLINEMDVS